MHRRMPVLCEIGKSAFRGREVLYPDPSHFGTSTAASCKDYMLDWSDFQIMVDVRSTTGIESGLRQGIVHERRHKDEAGGVPLNVPITVAGLGSTAVAQRNWEGLSVGCAISGTMQVIGENVCGMDPKATFDAKGKVTYSEDMEYRIKKYREFWDGKTRRHSRAD